MAHPLTTPSLPCVVSTPHHAFCCAPTLLPLLLLCSPSSPSQVAAFDGPPDSGAPGGESAAPSAPAAPTACADTPPPGGYSCQQQVGWGKCSDSIITSGNYCQLTCGRCSHPAAEPAAPSNGQPSSPAPVSAAPPTPTQGGCADVAHPGDYSCAQQKSFGKCSAAFMLQGSYCAATCSRCPTSPGASPQPQSGTSPGAQISEPSSPPSATPTGSTTTSGGCVDYIPPGQPPCSQWASWNGGCSNTWLVQGGFCKLTCGRCGGGGASASSSSPAPGVNGGRRMLRQGPAL